MDETVAERFRRMLRHPHGMMLVCGPTGSGKSTTLYVALQLLNRPDRNIITIEDPVEYRVRGVNQVQINQRAGVNFANILRSVVRQDPNIIMVGEIRDGDTADIGVRSALTGHLVLSSLHTNDAPGAITRLIDMGVEPYLVASSVVGALSQRLVRKICEHCAEWYAAGPNHPHTIALALPPGEYRLRRGKGCARCHNTGYRGRTGLFEMMPISEELRDLIVKQSPTNIIRRQAVAEGMTSLAEDGVRKVLAGTTTVEEVLRVTLLNQGGGK
jgi:type IV pilus assembly protein PilB